MRAFHFLLESNRKRYEPMFATILKLAPDMKRHIDTSIDWARRYLSRDDRIVWFLRWYRVWILSYERKYPESKVIDPQVRNRLLIQARATTGDSVGQAMATIRAYQQDITQLMTQLQHFMSMIDQAPQIDAVIFNRQTPSELLSELDKIEKKAFAELEAQGDIHTQLIVPQRDDTKLITFKDGWVWWLLDRPSCSEEAQAMGHCGNRGTREKSERILSLRKPVRMGNKIFWRPSLTFILDAEGHLGEMKGRGNDKPIDEYHPYIITLLENDIVKGIKGGGYLPKQNFSLNDLTLEQREALFIKKPLLAPFSFRFTKLGMSKDLIKSISAKLSATGRCEKGYPQWNAKTKTFRVEAFETVDQMILHNGSDFLKKVSDNFNGNGGFSENWEFPYDDETAKTVYDDLPKEILTNIGNYVKQKWEKEWQEREGVEFELDPTDSGEVWDIIIEMDDDEILPALKSAGSSGYQAGTENEMYADFLKVIEAGPSDAIVTPEYTRHSSEGKAHIVWDSPCWFVLTLMDAIHLCDDEDSYEGVDTNGWLFDDAEWNIDEPYSGWSGYDRATAIERAMDELPAEVTKPKPPQKKTRKKQAA